MLLLRGRTEWCAVRAHVCALRARCGASIQRLEVANSKCDGTCLAPHLYQDPSQGDDDGVGGDAFPPASLGGGDGGVWGGGWGAPRAPRAVRCAGQFQRLVDLRLSKLRRLLLGPLCAALAVLPALRVLTVRHAFSWAPSASPCSSHIAAGGGYYGCGYFDRCCAAAARWTGARRWLGGWRRASRWQRRWLPSRPTRSFAGPPPFTPPTRKLPPRPRRRRRRRRLFWPRPRRRHRALPEARPKVWKTPPGIRSWRSGANLRTARRTSWARP
jgi:hypothetical protein